MKTMSKRLVAAALTGALLLPTFAAAEAGSRNGWRDHRGGHHHNQRQNNRNHNRHKTMIILARLSRQVSSASLQEQFCWVRPASRATQARRR